MALLQLNGVSAAPWGPPLLQDINLQLEAGQIMAVIGPNGAGKSSLLHAIAGGLPITAGSIALNQRQLPDWRGDERARSMALQAQHSNLNFPFTVEQVILLGRIPHATGNTVDLAILDEVLAATDTISLRHRLFTQLSGGEKQRVQLARAVAQVWRSEDTAGRLLLLDEPSSALDLAHQRMVLGLMRQLADTGTAVMMATHDFNLVASRADQVLVLDGGSQHDCGKPHKVLTNEMFAQVFAVEVLMQSHPATGTPLVVQL